MLIQPVFYIYELLLYVLTIFASQMIREVEVNKDEVGTIVGIDKLLIIFDKDEKNHKTL